MARFVFQLRSVLRQREAVERRCMAEVARRESERAALEESIRTIQSDIGAARDDWRSSLGGGGPADLRSARLSAVGSLHLIARAQHQVLKLAGAHRRLDKARGELAEAAARRRAVELLRDRQYEAWKKAQDKLDEAAIDEIAVSAAARPEDHP
ncbi:MAG: flagellar FliJ family protein [Phycisphaerae bacterium]|nr:flagellar FliJ family protein [Phycisphaerae bacterium]